jgi:membrane-associated phospholipid phosphatase
MFQTEPILWLQAVGSPPVTWLLAGVSLLGYGPVYVVVLLALGFGVRLRPSLAVMVAAALAGLLVAGLKAQAALPRPGEVDARVRSGFRGDQIALVARGGAPDFWSRPSPESITAVRALAPHNFGFPSGHVAGATAVLLAGAVFFRSRAVLPFAGFYVPTMALSRMYLGRHFLADVLGGCTAGLVAVALAIPLVRGLEWSAFASRGRRGLAPVGLLVALLVLLARLVPLLSSLYVGSLAGLLLGYAFLALTGPPPEGGTTRHRLARAALALACFALGNAVCARQFVEFPGWSPARLAAGLLVTLTPIVVPIALARRLRLHG